MTTGKILSESIGSINMTRKAGKQTLNLRLAPEIEDIFIRSCEGKTIKHSNKKQSFDWYPVTEYSNKFQKWARKYYLNQPTQKLDMDRQWNYSLIFTKDISKGEGINFEFDDLTTKEQLQAYVDELQQVVTEIYNEFVSELTITHELSLKYVSV